MTAATLDLSDLRRWILSAAVVLAVHAGAAATLMHWREPPVGEEGTEPISVDLSAFVGPETQTQEDLAPGPLQQQSEVPPQPETPMPEKPEDKIETPPAPNPDVVLPPEPEKVPNKAKEQDQPAPIATAPPKLRPTAAQVASWHRQIALQVERYKGYPAAARARRETGTAQLAFTIDRQGKVIASKLVRSSGSTLLDLEALATIRRADPFPLPPANMLGETFDFTVPIRFNVKDAGR